MIKLKTYLFASSLPDNIINYDRDNDEILSSWGLQTSHLGLDQTFACQTEWMFLEQSTSTIQLKFTKIFQETKYGRGKSKKWAVL